MELKKINLEIHFREEKIFDLNGNVLFFLEDEVLENILARYKIIVNSKWSYLITLSISNNQSRIGKFISMTDPSTVSENMAKYCIGFVYKGDVLARIKERGNVEAMLGLMCEMLKVFFSENFKKVKSEDIDMLFNSLDVKHIKKLCRQPDLYPKKIRDVTPGVGLPIIEL
jgi:hypothetical protein